MKPSLRKFFSSVLLFQEKKDHLIKKLPQLNDIQKQELIDHLRKFPHKENMIDWNRASKLTWEDFLDVMEYRSKTHIKKQVSRNSIEGLIEGEDYEIAYEDEDFVAYVPLDHLASCMIASKRVGGVEGKWCTAMEDEDAHWEDYVDGNDATLVYVLDKRNSGENFGKIALIFYPGGYTEAFDQDDFQIHYNFRGRDKPRIFNAELKGYFPTGIFLKIKRNLGFENPGVETEKEFLVFEDKQLKDRLLKRNDGTYDIRGDLLVDGERFSSLEKFNIAGNIVHGDLIIDSRLSDFSLKGMPGIVKGSLKLTVGSLAPDGFKYLPKKIGEHLHVTVDDGQMDFSYLGDILEVGGDFRVYADSQKPTPGNKIRVPQKVGGAIRFYACGLEEVPTLPKKIKSLSLQHNKIRDLKGFQPGTKVEVDLNLSHNLLESLKGCPEVGSNFYVDNNKLTSLEGGPTNKLLTYNCENNLLKNFIGAPEKVTRFLARKNPLESLEGFPDPEYAGSILIDEEWRDSFEEIKRQKELREKKDHIIKKLDQFSDEQKEILIKHFRKFPHKENMIDWNISKDLTWKDFEDVLEQRSKTHIKKQVKAKGFEGLEEGKDYKVLVDNYPMMAVLPLNHLASCMIASSKVAGVEGKWCTAMSHDDSYWSSHIREGKLVYLLDFESSEKIAAYYHFAYENSPHFFDEKDKEMYFSDGEEFLEKLGVGYQDLLKLAKKAWRERPLILTHQAESYDGIWDGSGEWKNGTFLHGDWRDGVWGNGIWVTGTWVKGKWIKGTWENGVWENGIWEDGVWERGLWKNGTWRNGKFSGGIWLNGTWKNGYFENGIWSDGIWEDGVWEFGTWEGGKFLSGVWLDGVWEDGYFGKGIWWEGRFIDGVWDGGEWVDGEWLGGEWKKGFIFDSEVKRFVFSKINPREYELNKKGKKKE